MAATVHTTVDTTAAVPQFRAALSPAPSPDTVADAAVGCCGWCCSHSLLRMLSVLPLFCCSEMYAVRGLFHEISYIPY